MTNEQTSSLLYPPEGFVRLSRLPSPTVYALDGETLAAALNHQAAQPLPDPSQMFPWLHGLHPDNHLQLGFFSSRKRSARRAPKCWRGITVVKLGGDLTKARIKGAVTAQEVITPSARFLMSDPPEGFSVRNFHIQTAKLAAMSDIVVYAEDGASRSELLALAEDFVTAQQAWRLKNDPAQERPAYNTFVLTSKSLCLCSGQGSLNSHPVQVALPTLKRNAPAWWPSTLTAIAQAKSWTFVS
jgi:dual specificity MAP kinase phosphatase